MAQIDRLFLGLSVVGVLASIGYAPGMICTDDAKTDNAAPAPAAIEPLMISRTDAARALGVSVRTLERWVTEGRLPARQTGARWMIATADLRAFVASLPRA